MPRRMPIRPPVWFCFPATCTLTSLPRDAVRKRGLSYRRSVCPFVCHDHVLYPDGWRYRQTSFSTRYPIILVFFWRQALVTNSKGNPFRWGHKVNGWENLRCSSEIAVYLRNSTRQTHLLWNINRRRIDTCQFGWPWVTPNPNLQVNLPGGQSTRGEVVIFDWNHRLPRIRYEIGPWLLWNVNRKS